jgi:hypothetical protein
VTGCCEAPVCPKPLSGIGTRRRFRACVALTWCVVCRQVCAWWLPLPPILESAAPILRPTKANAATLGPSWHHRSFMEGPHIVGSFYVFHSTPLHTHQPITKLRTIKDWAHPSLFAASPPFPPLLLLFSPSPNPPTLSSPFSFLPSTCLPSSGSCSQQQTTFYIPSQQERRLCNRLSSYPRDNQTPCHRSPLHHPPQHPLPDQQSITLVSSDCQHSTRTDREDGEQALRRPLPSGLNQSTHDFQPSTLDYLSIDCLKHPPKQPSVLILIAASASWRWEESSA